MPEGIWWASYAALWVLVLLEATVILALARQMGVMLKRLPPIGARMGNPGLDLGDIAPAISDYDLNLHLVTLGVERNKPTLLIFISPNCSACVGLASAIRTVYQHEKDQIEMIVISLLKDEVENQAFVKRNGLERVPYMISPTIADKYQIATSPYAILIDSAGKVRTKGIVNDLDHLESLLNALDEGYPSFDSKMNTLVSARNSATQV